MEFDEEYLQVLQDNARDNEQDDGLMESIEENDI